MPTRAPLSLFYSYAHEDGSLREQLVTHLSLLRRQGLISEWHDREILPGAKWAEEIDEHLERASIILLLISPAFLASDYCYDIEMQRALERHRRGEVRVIPIILRPCDWRNAPFAGLQSLPRDGTPVTKWSNPDDAFFDVTQGLRRVIAEYPGVAVTPPFPLQLEPTPALHFKATSIEQQNRECLIRRVRNDWVKGVFEKSLHNAALITLGLEESPAAIENPWRLVIQESERASTPLPAGTRITEVYDDADGELLILGEPGAGKTTLLLELARDLLNRAEQEQAHPIPVIFNLSSWTRKRQPLAAWLIEEMETRYKVPRKVGSDWINADQILPLLDGLDEVDATSRTACMQAINEYHQAHSLIPLVVCSRVNEYMSQESRLTLYRAVTIQPLTTEQINEYFVRIGEQVGSLRVAFQSDSVLQELATTPLMLTILILAYQGSSLEEIKGGVSTEVRQQQIFATYTQRTLHRRKALSRYSPQQTIHWLSYLARQMKQQGQTVFYIERMQPSWLMKKWQRQLYAGLIAGPVCGLLVGVSTLHTLLPFPLTALIVALIVGLLFGWLSELETEKKGARAITHIWMHIPQSLATALESRVRIGIIATLVGAISDTPYGYFVIYSNRPFIDRIVNSLNFGIFNGIYMGLLLGLAIKLDRRIEPMEVLGWSWIGMRREIVRWLLVCIGTALILELIITLPLMIYDQRQDLLNSLLTQLSYMFYLTLVTILVNGVTQGLSKRVLDVQDIVTPNQGTWRSGRYGVLIAIITGMIATVFTGVVNLITYVWLPAHMGIVGPHWQEFWQERWIQFALFWGLIHGALLGLTTGLYYGGSACVQHFVLRFLLWCARCVPLNYPRFLDYAAERILLRKVGGGYIFIHRLLLEYFASLEKEQDPREVDAYKHKQDALV